MGDSYSDQGSFDSRQIASSNAESAAFCHGNCNPPGANLGCLSCVDIQGRAKPFDFWQELCYSTALSTEKAMGMNGAVFMRRNQLKIPSRVWLGLQRQSVNRMRDALIATGYSTLLASFTTLTN